MQRPPELAFPLDVPTLGEAKRWLAILGAHVDIFKVGLELFTKAGPDAVRAVHDAGAECFLDLKLHDIPATMARATKAASALGVRYLSVHAEAGTEALRRCEENSGDLSLLAVTVLTSASTEQLKAHGIEETSEARALRLAKIAHAAGIRGFVCSAHECQTLRAELSDIELVVPGIRPEGVQAHDQTRIATPEAAIKAGANVLVVGRPIRLAKNPIEAAQRIARAARQARRELG